MSDRKTIEKLSDVLKQQYTEVMKERLDYITPLSWRLEQDPEERARKKARWDKQEKEIREKELETFQEWKTKPLSDRLREELLDGMHVTDDETGEQWCRACFAGRWDTDKAVEHKDTCTLMALIDELT